MSLLQGSKWILPWALNFPTLQLLWICPHNACLWVFVRGCWSSRLRTFLESIKQAGESAELAVFWFLKLWYFIKAPKLESGVCVCQKNHSLERPCLLNQLFISQRSLDSSWEEDFSWLSFSWTRRSFFPLLPGDSVGSTEFHTLGFSTFHFLRAFSFYTNENIHGTSIY